jgi:hypothetical protein
VRTTYDSRVAVGDRQSAAGAKDLCGALGALKWPNRRQSLGRIDQPDVAFPLVKRPADDLIAIRQDAKRAGQTIG